MLLCRTDPETRRAKGIPCLPADMQSPGMPGPEASIIKLHWTELTQSMPEIAMQLLGPEGLLYDTPRPDDGTHAPPEQWVQRGYLGARAASIASGTSEIMRGIIAMQVLGLPRGT